jgi:hypothetical protein
MAKSVTAAQHTRQEVIESLRQVLADIEAGKLRGGGWREQYIASAIGLLASGCIAEAATHAAQARSTAGLPTRQASAADLLRGLDFVAGGK